MRILLLAIAISTAFFLAGCASKPNAGSGAGPTGAEIGDVIAQVKSALADVQTDLSDSRLPPLKQVKLTLKTILSDKISGSIKLLVITVGGSLEEEKVQQLEIVLVPPSPGNPKQISTQSVTQGLKDAILSAAVGVRAAGAGQIPLNVSGVEVTLGLTVKAGGSAEAKPEILPITLNLSGGLSKSAIHTLVVTFAAAK